VNDIKNFDLTFYEWQANLCLIADPPIPWTSLFYYLSWTYWFILFSCLETRKQLHEWMLSFVDKL